MIPSSIIAQASKLAGQGHGEGVFSKLSPSDNAILNRQMDQEDLQFPQELGENEYNQFILFTSYENAGEKTSSQRRAAQRDQITLGEQLPVAEENKQKLVAEALDYSNYEDRMAPGAVLSGPGRPATLPGTFIGSPAVQQPTLNSFAAQNPGEAFAYYDTSLSEVEAARETALQEVDRLNTNIDRAKETEQANTNVAPSLSTGRGHESFINDRSRSTIEQQKLLGIERRASSEGRMRMTAATHKSNTNIALYLPNKLVNSGSIGYNNVNFELIQAGKNVVEDFAEGKNTTALVNIGGLALRSIASIIDGAASIAGVAPEASAALQQVTGLAINPRQQQTFQGVQTRGFDFTFSFAPKNQKEAVEVSKIIRAFRKKAHPSLNNKTFLNVPDEFEIRYYKVFNNGVVAENLFLNKIGRCALTAVNVDYTPNGINATFPDGSPVRTSLTMQFTELRPLTREDIEEGY